MVQLRITVKVNRVLKYTKSCETERTGVLFQDFNE